MYEGRKEMLFDSDSYFNGYNDMLYNFPGLDFSKKYEEKDEGFLKGNMFPNEYKPYKNYTYLIPKIKTEKDKDLFKVMEASFAVNDYVLALDLNPNDENLFAKYKMWCEKLEKCSKEYESKYGPLCYTKGNNYNSFKWVNGSWPWESVDVKYV